MRLTMLIMLLLIPVQLWAGASTLGSVALTWVASTDPDLAGYNVYYSGPYDPVIDPGVPSLPFDGTAATQGSSPFDVGNVLTTTLDNLDYTQNWYFAVTAYNSVNMESVYSNIIRVGPVEWNSVHRITWPAHLGGGYHVPGWQIVVSQ